MKTVIFVIMMFVGSFVNAKSFYVADDGEVGAYFISSTAAYENLLSITFDSKPLEITPSINNHSSVFGQYTSYGVRHAGDGVNFHDFVTDTYNLWSNDQTKNYDGFDHMFYSEFTLPDGIPALFVGFEDLYGGGDKDFDDIVAVFTNVSAVPEPATYVMLLAGLGLIGWRFTSPGS